MILYALNDSFLSESCYPIEFSKKISYVNLEIPKHGGHVGFISPCGVYYNELRALEFFSKFD